MDLRPVSSNETGLKIQRKNEMSCGRLIRLNLPPLCSRTVFTSRIDQMILEIMNDRLEMSDNIIQIFADLIIEKGVVRSFDLSIVSSRCIIKLELKLVTVTEQIPDVS